MRVQIDPVSVRALASECRIASAIKPRALEGSESRSMPGSPSACRDAWDGILKEQLDYRRQPCNFVEIMPRLDEHLRRH